MNNKSYLLELPYMRMHLRKIPLFFLVLTLLNLITIITAPYTIPPNTVRGVDGKANVIESFERWDDLNPYALLIYTLGDLSCHQKESRSFLLNDNQMPVCARDTGLAFSFFIGTLLFIFTIPHANPFVMALTPLFREKSLSFGNKRAVALNLTFAWIFMTPMALDGILQALTGYESTNTVRYVTGLLFGWVFILGIGVYLESYIFRHIYERKAPDKDVNSG